MQNYFRKLLNSKKKLTLWFCICILGFIFFAYRSYHIEGKSSRINIDKLSDRAKEFIEDEKQKSESSWKHAEFVQSEQRKADASPKTFTTQCMVIHFPYLSRAEYIADNPDHCKIELRMQSPPARVIFSFSDSTESLTDNANVTMREKFDEEYIEESFFHENWQEAMLFFQKDGAVVFLKNNDQLITIGITEMIDREKLSVEMIEAIVKGVELVAENENQT